MDSQIVVSNTTPLIALAFLKQLDLVPALFNTLYVPQAVYNEIQYKPNAPGAFELRATSWLKIKPVEDTLAVSMLLDQLDAGESEAIVLARELQADLLLMDERRGRRRAIQADLNVVGTLGILINARQQNLIGPIRPLLDRLQELPFRMSEKLYQEVLRQVGEAD
jgi:predicted nucleic acid-binding protein